MSTTVHRLPFYLNSTEQLLISLQKLGGLVALESKGKDHPNAEWSIISAAPTTKIEHNNTSSSKDFLSNIRKLAYSANLSREEKNNLKHLNNAHCSQQQLNYLCYLVLLPLFLNILKQPLLLDLHGSLLRLCS